MAKKTKRELLQAYWDENRSENQHDFEIVWKGRGGWWAMTELPRFFGDRGEFLGYNYRQALRWLKRLVC